MTIAVGFRCQDGIVLCTDSEMSKGYDLKFKGPKIFLISPDAMAGEWVLLTAYSGYENIAKRVLQLIAKKIEPLQKTYDLPQKIEKAIESVLVTERKKHRMDLDRLQILYALSIKGDKARFLNSWGKILSESQTEYIGGGDTSIGRFLSDLLCPMPGFLNTQQALMIALYLVSNAKKYVGGCGKETQAVIVSEGSFRSFPAPIISYREKHIEMVESSVAEIMRAFLDIKLTQDERKMAISKFSDEMTKLGQLTEI